MWCAFEEDEESLRGSAQPASKAAKSAASALG